MYLRLLQSTRLVTIIGGPPMTPIRCRFCVQEVKSGSARPFPPMLDRVFQVFSKRTVDYEALSYVWGPDSQPGEVIFCDGQPLKITANLADAIRHLRLPDQPRTLWIDQICINQQDMAERSNT
ncbi:heterokaryon incompatibility protein-domain-containing protein [Rhypophila decipiens]|uniref:Heterokaryon incompatibility protein-domain-containing protein n=1 Tax=Rhypophila decipiens TaxID=261697 RepID=A0AAN7BCV2_9PEZI|nr:heterokaryon incompatibility protein-domain-containing protein [Rhypophila decipiens]